MYFTLKGRKTTTTTTTKPTKTPTPIINATSAIAKFERGNQACAGEFLYQLVQSRPGENFMISGFSILILLASLALQAVGITAQQILHLLNLDNKAEIETIFPIIINNYRTQQQVILKLANKAYFSELTPPTNEFSREMKDIFQFDVQSLDFNKNVEAAGIMNQWVEENTNGLIKNLVNPSVLNRDTRCVLINALYFLGNWTHQFDKKDTKPRDFYISETKTVSLDTMYLQEKFNYGESDKLDCQILELPYKGGNLSLVGFLPRQKAGLSAMVEKLRNPDNFVDAMASLAQETVRVYMPVMDVTSDFPDLIDLLKKVNLTGPFQTDVPSFEGITLNDDLHISDVMQKTRLKVDESGTEAAAATAVVVGLTAVFHPQPKIYEYNCDHPIVFYLVLGRTPLFFGVFAGSK